MESSTHSIDESEALDAGIDKLETLADTTIDALPPGVLTHLLVLAGAWREPASWPSRNIWADCVCRQWRQLLVGAGLVGAASEGRSLAAVMLSVHGFSKALHKATGRILRSPATTRLVGASLTPPTPRPLALVHALMRLVLGGDGGGGGGTAENAAGGGGGAGSSTPRGVPPRLATSIGSAALSLAAASGDQYVLAKLRGWETDPPIKADTAQVRGGGRVGDRPTDQG